jgi:hypothetical protein
MAKHSSNKSEVKPLIPCPEIQRSEYLDSVTVSTGSNGDVEVVTIRIPVGSAQPAVWSDKGHEISGVLTLDNCMVEIRGVKHWIRLNSGWHNGKRVGQPSISIVPANEKAAAPKAAAPKIAF